MARIVLANDHGAVEIAALIKDHLQKRGFDVTYLGVGSPESVDYPDKAEEAVNEFRKGGYEFGVLCCGTGIGISLAANKMNGIRCALPQNSYAAKMSREHNNVNFIAFGGRIEYQDKIEDMLDAYIDSTFQGGKHERRVEKIMSLEGR